MLKRIALLSMTVLVIPGCVERPLPEEPVAARAPLRLMSLPASATRMEAALSGRLLLDSGCVQVERRSGRASVVWSGGADVDPSGAVLYRDRRFAHGDQVKFGGGFVTATDHGALQSQIAGAQCPAPYFLVQTVEDPL